VKRLSLLTGISLVALLTLPACGGEKNSPGAVPGVQSEEALGAEAAPRPAGDELLLEARYSIVGGSVDPDLQGKILASDASSHVRARRILAAMERESSGQPDPDAKPEPEPPRPGVAIPASGQVPKIKAPAPGIEPTEVKTSGAASKKGSGSGSSSSSSSGAASTASASGSAAPSLSVLTRLSLRGSSEQVVLRLNAADRVVMGMAEQPQSGLLRLVVESAGALPGFLQARPEVHGIKVVDVRRGDDTVQISIQMQEGWRAQGPRSGAGGASLTFVREG
jgi:hypothetical protein